MGFNSKYKSSEIEEILDDANEKFEVINNIVDEDGYLYSNGEKVDMRFTRSLLPVGTAIPASVNLNTIQYLKIGKYYCSLNANAETITNCPVKVAFSMEVFNPLGTNVDDETTREYTYRLRVLTQYDSGTQYMQFCKTSGTAGSWTYGDWYAAPRTKATLNSNKKGSTLTLGSATQGVYVNSTGVLTKMTYTLGKSVPSNAVFTDTDTKVTSVSNHYSPTEDDSVALNAPDGEVIVGLKRDATGHIVGIETAQYIGGGEVQITKAPIATNYAIYFDDSNPMLPGKVYVGYSGYTIVEIQTLTPPTGTYGEYKLHFYAPSASTTISLPDYVLLANGEIATPEAGSYYELSIVATRESLYDSFVYSAVLTPFKSI